MTNPLNNLKIDSWYKVLLILTSISLLTSLTVDLKDINNNIAQLISIGIIFICLGEWINHPLQTWIQKPTIDMPAITKFTGHPRNNSFLGILFIIIGLLFIGFGIYKIF